MERCSDKVGVKSVSMNRSSLVKKLSSVIVIFAMMAALVLPLLPEVVLAAAPTLTITSEVVPDVDTTTCAQTANTTATGGKTLTTRGFEYDDDGTGAPYSYDEHENGTFASTGSWSLTLTGLTPDTTYYIRAYGTNADGTGYSAETTFHTPPANCYWVPSAGGTASGNWTDDDNHWSDTDDGASRGDGHLPGVSSNVFFNANSGFTAVDKTVTNDASPYCADMDWTGAANNPVWAMSNQSAFIYGSLTLSAGMTMTGNAGIYFSGVTPQTITTNGVVAPVAQWTINGVGGIYTLQDDLSLLGTLLVSRGTLDTNDKTITVPTFSILGTNARVVDLSASIINISTSWTATTITNLTLTEGTSSMRLTGTAAFVGGGETYYELQLNGTAHTVSGANTFTNLIRTGTATKTDTLTLSANQTITGTLTLNGNSATNRLLVQSNTPATYRTLTAAAVSASNVDFLDIQGAGAASWDLSAISGGSGNAGHNAGITFTTEDDCYWVDNSGEWSDITHWASTSGGVAGSQRVPLVQDNAIFDANSITIDSRVIELDMPRIGNIDCEDVLNSPQFDGDGAGGGTVYIYGDVVLGTQNITPAAIYFYGRGIQNITSNGAEIDTSNAYMYNYGAVLQLEDDLIVANSGIAGNYFHHCAGTLNLNGHTLFTTIFDTYQVSTYTRSVAWNLATIQVALGFYSHGTNLTIGANTGTLRIHNDTVTSFSFVFNTPTTYFNDIYIEGSGNYAVTNSTAAITCNNLIIDRSEAAKTISGNVTITLTSGMSIPTSGTTVVTITNTDFSKASGIVAATYLSISGSSAGGGATYYAGTDPPSTDGGGNAGWNFSDPVDPTLDTNNATNLELTTATLNGDVDTMGAFSTLYVYFQYSLTGTFTGEELETAEQTCSGAGAFSANVIALSSDVDYYYRIAARYNINSYVYGDTVVFNTSGKPVVQTNDAVSVSTNDATLRGTLLSLGIYSGADVWFEFGETVAYGYSTVPETYTSTGSFDFEIDGLALDTTYHFIAHATYVKDEIAYTVDGADNSFTTLRTEGATGVVQVLGAAVFQNYTTTGDLLFVAEVVNTYPPYYKVTNPADYFVVQLLDPTETKVLAATPLKQWDMSPVGIYLSSNSASYISYGGAYVIRMIGTFATPPDDTYTLQALDWKGSDLTRLDDWVRATAEDMNVYFGFSGASSLTAKEVGGSTVLSNTGGTYFVTGITGLMAVRPDIFLTTRRTPNQEYGTATNAYDTDKMWQAQVGETIAADAEVFGDVLNVTAKQFLSLGIWAAFAFAMLFIFASAKGSESVMVMVLCVPILFSGAYFRIIELQIILVMGAVLALLFVLKMFFTK